jgi:hypothetical protein
MKKLFLLCNSILTLILLIQFIGCSEKVDNKLIGKWRVESDSILNIPNLEAIYEFSETKYTVQMTIPEIPTQTLEIDYKIKSDNGKILFLEVVHPATKAIGIFTFTFEKDERATLIDPNGQSIKLMKVQDK